MRRAVPLLSLLLLALAGPVHATIKVQAVLEPEVLGLDETALFTVEIQGDGFGPMGFRQPEFDLENFEIVGGPYQQEDIRFANGRLTRTYRISWRLRPLTTGTARVNSIAIRVRGTLVQIGDREISVQAESTGNSRGEPQQDPMDRLLGRLPWQRRPEPTTPGVFLRAEVTPAHPYVGEQTLYTVYLYTRQDILAANAREVPTFRGFWVRDVPQPQNLPTEFVDLGGSRYGRVVLLQKALFPLRPGEHTIEPSAMDLVIRTFERRFFGPPLSSNEELSLRTPPRTVDVRPLPPAPAQFGGAVGQLALAARLQPAEVRLGEAAT
ncbi:MAG TPA: BatD family protein, partial [Thermoanaerobaculia bacterium]|nr:BatD family protein [Thermoanaerobaculia bacterium]